MNLKQLEYFVRVAELGSFTRSRVLLDRVAQAVHHLVDLGLERVHLTTCFDRNEACKVTVGRCSRHVGAEAGVEYS